jgi:hypothetical protein
VIEQLKAEWRREAATLSPRDAMVGAVISGVVLFVGLLAVMNPLDILGTLSALLMIVIGAGGMAIVATRLRRGRGEDSQA